MSDPLHRRHLRYDCGIAMAAILLASCGTQAPSAAPSREPAGAPSPGASPTTGAGASPTAGAGASPIAFRGVVGHDWRRVSLPAELSEGMTLLDVAAGPGGLVAVGEARTGRPVAWSSPDGIRWTKGESLPWPGAPPASLSNTRAETDAWRGQTNVRIMVGASGYVILDGDREGWTSPDGRTFTELDSVTSGLADPVGAIKPGYVEGAAAGGGLLAVSSGSRGYYDTGLGFLSNDEVPLIWSSTDGASWKATTIPVAVKGQDSRRIVRHAAVIAAGPGGLLVAGTPIKVGPNNEYGYTTFPPGAMDVWTSPDGATWQHVGSPAFGPDKGRARPIAGLVTGTRMAIVGAADRTSGYLPTAWVGGTDGWSRAALPVTDGAVGAAEAITSIPDGLLALGWEADAAGSRALAWTSPDGTEWERHALGASTPGNYPDERANAVAAIEAGLVAVGSDQGDAAVWLSGTFDLPTPAASIALVSTVADDATRSTDPDARGFADARIDDMIELPGGYLAAGTDLGSGRPAIWQSADARTWARLAPERMPPSAPYESGFDLQRNARVDRTHGPYRVAVSGATLLVVDPAGGRWRSTDGGTTWTAPARVGSGLNDRRMTGHKDAWYGQRVDGLLGTDTGFVGVGNGCLCHPYATGDFEAAAWTSPDGMRWTLAPYDVRAFGPAGVVKMHAVVRLGGRYVAAGDLMARNGTFDMAAWTSADGRTWHRSVVAAPGNQGVSAMAARDDLVVAVGKTEAADMSEALPAAWSSPDGVHWTAIKLDAPDAGPLATMAAGARGFLAAGVAGTSGPTGVHVAYFTSPDGRTWSRHDFSDGRSSSDLRVSASLLTSDASLVGGSINGNAIIYRLDAP